MGRLRRCRSSSELSSSSLSFSPADLPLQDSAALEAIQRVAPLFDEVTIANLQTTTYPAVTYPNHRDSYSLVGKEVGLDPPLWLCTPCKSLMSSPPPLIDLRPTGATFRELRANMNARLENGAPYVDIPKSTDTHFKTGRPGPVEDWLLHHQNLFQLIDCCYGTRTPCQLCQVIWRGIRRGLSNRRTRTGRIRGYQHNMEDWLVGPRHFDCHAGLRVARQVTSGTACLLCLNLPLTQGGQSRWITLSPFSEYQHVEGHNPLGDSTDSAQSLSQIHRWLDLCKATHMRCKLEPRSSDEWPTRLLSLDPECRKARLVETGGLKTTIDNGTPEYVTLSYRWGSDSSSTGIDNHPLRALTLTKENERHLRAGVDISALPKTIRDACRVVARMGYHYIWVDRFCIIQDSFEDWNREATRMAQVYKQAVFTISASCAADEDDGIFRSRGVNGGGVAPIKLITNPLVPAEMQQFDCRDHEEGRAKYCYSIRSREPSQRGDPRSTKLGYLATRGWVFQERALSKRVVHFTGESLYWECSNLETSEENIHNKRLDTYERPTVAMDITNEIYGLKYVWAQIVQLYSQYELTFAHDRLPALSGLAKETKRTARSGVLNEEYYAGLWKSTFVHDLCWNDFDRKPRTSSNGYIAPSWSWASYKNNITWSMYASGETTRQLAHLHDICLKYAGEDKFGAVLDGWMVLEGHLLCAMALEVEKAQRYAHWLGGSRRMLTLGDEKCKILNFVETQDGALEVDHLVESLESGCVPLFCVPLIQDGGKPHAWKPVVWCLLLGPDGLVRYHGQRERIGPPSGSIGGSQYQRIGWIKLDVKDVNGWNTWLGQSPKQKLVVW